MLFNICATCIFFYQYSYQLFISMRRFFAQLQHCTSSPGFSRQSVRGLKTQSVWFKAVTTNSKRIQSCAISCGVDLFLFQINGYNIKQILRAATRDSCYP